MNITDAPKTSKYSLLAPYKCLTVGIDGYPTTLTYLPPNDPAWEPFGEPMVDNEGVIYLGEVTSSKGVALVGVSQMCDEDGDGLSQIEIVVKHSATATTVRHSIGLDEDYGDDPHDFVAYLDMQRVVDLVTGH